MGAHTSGTVGRSTTALLSRFALLLRARYGARLYLFGSRARGDFRPDSDVDLVAVADAFGAQPRLGRAPDRGELWRAAGGAGVPLDLHCLTPAELAEENAGGFGAIGSAGQRGELRPVGPTPRRRRSAVRVAE